MIIGRWFNSSTTKNCFRLLLLSVFLAILWLPLPKQVVSAQSEDTGEDKPSIIQVSLSIVDIPKVDEPSETFDVDAYLYLEWNDPSAYEFVKDRNMVSEDGIYRAASTEEALATLEDIGWSYTVEFSNQVGERDVLASVLFIQPNGSIGYGERFWATFSSEYELSKYPFDRQIFHMRMESIMYDATEVIFEPNRMSYYKSPQNGESSEKPGLTLEEWDLGPEIVSTNGTYLTPGGNDWSFVNIEIQAQRKYGYHLWKIFLPLILIISISWSVFWIRTENVTSRLQISSIFFLTAISFSFFISGSLPKISYLTYMDFIIVGIYIFMVLTSVEILVTHSLDVRGKGEAAARLNHHARWLLPVSLLLYVLIVTLVLWL